MEVARLSRFRQRSDGGLQISGLVPDDTGMFQCFARNAAGEVQTSTYLAVTSKSGPPRPAPEPLPPRARPLCSKPGASGEETGSLTREPGWPPAPSRPLRGLGAKGRVTGSLREAAPGPAQAFPTFPGSLLCGAEATRSRPGRLAHLSKERNLFRASAPTLASPFPTGGLCRVMSTAPPA